MNLLLNSLLTFRVNIAEYQRTRRAYMSHKYSGEDLMAMRDNLSPDKDLYIGIREACRFYFDPQHQNSYLWRNKVSEKITPQDSIGITATRDLVSGIYSNTIDFSSEFFGYQIAGKLKEDEDVKDYLSKCSEIALNKLAASNYGKSVLETLRGYVVVNTGVQYSEFDHIEKKIRFNTFMIDHCVIAENKNFIIDTVFREFEMTAVQAFQKWGDKIPNEVMRQYKDVNQKYEPSLYYHCVFPREDYREKRSKRLRSKRKVVRHNEQRFASYYVYGPDKQIIEEGGYKSMPYAVPRYDRVSETPYGRGNSFTAKAIMSELEKLCYSISDGIELGVNPPIAKHPASSDQFVNDITPGGSFYMGPNGEMPEFYKSNINVQDAAGYKLMLHKEIEDLFYVNLFKTFEAMGRREMTATEAAMRQGESILLLLPVISNIYDELYSVQLKRVFHLLNDNGFFPDMPEELAEVWDEEQLKIDYTTKLDLKLKQLEIGQILKSVEEIMILGKAKIEAPDLQGSLNFTKLEKEILRMNGVSTDYILTEAQTDEYFAAKKKQQEHKEALEIASQALKPLDLTQAVDKNSILAHNQAQIGKAGII